MRSSVVFFRTKIATLEVCLFFISSGAPYVHSGVVKTVLEKVSDNFKKGHSTLHAPSNALNFPKKDAFFFCFYLFFVSLWHNI